MVLRGVLKWQVAWLAGLTLAACTPRGPGGEESAKGPGQPPPAADTPLLFWHTQTQENDTALQAIVADFNAAHPAGPPVQPVYIGDYDALYQKIRASAAVTGQRVLPELAVAYESMIADYMAANIVRPLDDLVADPQLGLDAASLADIYPGYLETNRFAQFGGQLLSFPFTKSNLMLYYNQEMLEEVGETAPRTWDDLVRCCRKIKEKRGLAALAVNVDPSTFDGQILSMGGKLISADGKDAGFDSPTTVDVLRLYATLFQHQYAYQTVDKGDQNNDFGNQKCAFFFRSSTARPFIADLVAGQFKWDLAGLPVKAGIEPLTVMFGANICLFRSSPEREQQAWQFIKFFTSTPITARWAMATGYLPVRKTAADDPAIQKFFAAAPQNRRAFDLLPTAVTEPNVAGWQAVRQFISDALTNVINAQMTPEEAAAELDQRADEALQTAEE